MKRLLPVLMGFALLLLSSTEGWSLPRCPGTPTESNTLFSVSWTDCFGTLTFDSGEKYVGEWKENKKHGQGTYTYADGRKDAGEWKEDKFVK